MIDVGLNHEFDVETQLAYLKDAETGSHLSAEEQAEHIRLYRDNGDENHKEVIVQTNLLFVASIARRFHSHKLTLPDLMSAGMLGLLKAFEKFDLDRNVSFISYARYWIEQFIRKEIAYNSNIVRIPFHSYRLLKRVRTLVEEGWTNRAIEQEMNLSRAKISLLKIAGKEVSINQQLTSEDDFTVQDTLSQEHNEIDDFYKNEDEHFLLEKVELLNGREKDIICRRFGLSGYNSQTLQEISEHYEISRERVRQIEARAIRKLRTMCAGEIIDHENHYQF